MTAKYHFASIVNGVPPKSPSMNQTLSLASTNQKWQQHSSRVIAGGNQLGITNNTSQQNNTMNLSMRNANKTISLTNKDSFVKFAKDQASIVNNFVSNNAGVIGQNQNPLPQQTPLFTAQRVKIQSKSPPQQNSSITQLPQINQNLNKTGSFLRQRKSLDNGQNNVNCSAMQDFNLYDHAKRFEQVLKGTRKGSQQMPIQEQSLINESSMSQSLLNTADFNPNSVKLKLKPGVSEAIEKEIILEKAWLRQNIPHIARVIQDVKDDEGVEITINCNVEAFNWIIMYLKKETSEEELYRKVNDQNCLNLIVSTCFLGLTDLYNLLWRMYFLENFVTVINDCQLNLKSINQAILDDIAARVDDEQIYQLTERKDKFISQVFKAKAEHLMNRNEIKACTQCFQVQTKVNFKKISCIQNELQDEGYYIQAQGKIYVRHQYDKSFNKMSFLNNYREKYRVCWKETYEKIKAMVENCMYCRKCDQWFSISQIGHCKYHDSQPFPSSNFNEYVYVCCMANEISFAGCHNKVTQGCLTDFHDFIFENEAQQHKFNNFKEKWLLIKDALQKETQDKVIQKYQESITFYKPQSLNFQVSLSQAYKELKQATIQQQSYDNPNVSQPLDDTLFRVPQAQQAIQILQNDPLLKEQIAKTAKQIVRSRSPDQSHLSSQENLMGNQIRLTLDAESNQLTVKKRCLSPHQIKEVQNATKRKIWETKQDILREDDFKSMKMLTQLLKQHRHEQLDSTNSNSLSSQRNIITSRDKLLSKEHSYFIDISQISSINSHDKLTVKSRETLITKRSNNSQERSRRRKSPSFIIKPTQITRKASPNY